MCLCAFLDTHLEVDGVAYDVDLGRLQVIEQVTIIPIVVANGVIVLREALVHELLVVDVTLLHAQCGVQIVGSDDGIAHPRDVTQVVALTFVQTDKHVDMLVVDGPYGVFDDGGIAVTQFVILIDEGFLGLFVAFGGELLGLEDVLQLAGLVDLAEGALFEQVTLDLVVFQLLVALEDDAAHLHLRLLVNIDIENHLVLAGDVVALHNLNLCILITLVVEVFLGQNLSAVEHVGGNLAAFHDTKLSLHVLTF